MNVIEQIQERKNKKKARRWATLLLIVLLLLLFIPFGDGRITDKPKFNNVIEVTFDNVEEFQSKAAAAKSSARKASAKIESPVENPPPEAIPEEIVEEVPEPEVIPEPEPVREPVRRLEPISKLSPVNNTPVLSDNSTNLQIDVSKMLEQVSESAKVEQVNDQVTEVVEDISDDFMADISDYFSKAKSRGQSTGKTNDGPTGASSDGPGEGDSGSSDSGDSGSDGQAEFGDAGDGLDGDGFEGDGLLTRKVVFRPNLNDLMKESGKIVINLCVNRDGKVIYSESDRRASTISSSSLLRQAELTAEKYRYEKDYTVAPKQCGKLSFLVKIKM